MSQKLDAKIALILLTIRHEKERLEGLTNDAFGNRNARVDTLSWVLRQIVEIDERVK